MISQELQQSYQAVLPTYARYDAAFVRGQGAKLYDESGREYIDFASGIGVNSVGYAHPQWVAAVAEQAAALAHTSNLFYTKPAAALAERLTALSGLSKVFFANSGAEANEGMIKCARKYSHDKYGAGRETILTLRQSFHGRTVTTLAATGQDSFHQHFMPFTTGFQYVPADDLQALESYQSSGVCAVMIELIQGEGGVLPLPRDYVTALAEICERNDWLLLADEVQTGIGRTGRWFAFQDYGVTPDIVSFAKGIAGGLPMGGFLTGAKTTDVLGAGTHATTFGGNCICAAAALATLDILEAELAEIPAKESYIRQALEGLPAVRELRGRGLMLGIRIDGAPRDYAARALERGLVALTAGQDAIRLLPPLTISYEELDTGLTILRDVLSGD